MIDAGSVRGRHSPQAGRPLVRLNLEVVHPMQVQRPAR